MSCPSTPTVAVTATVWDNKLLQYKSYAGSSRTVTVAGRATSLCHKQGSQTKCHAFTRCAYASVICEGYDKDNEVAVVDMMEGGGEFLSISKGL